MKKIIALTLGLIVVSSTMAQKDPVILTINDTQVTKSEFLQSYLKNNNDPKYDKATLDEYVELYKKFKLKVAEAEALGYDTIPSLVKELEGYRKQLALPYLVDSTKNQELVDEGYKRLQQEVRASHILIRVDEKANPADTLKAYKKILKLRDRIIAGEDFETVAAGANGSEDPSVAQNKGDLGYFTAFQMVYPFETAAYETEIGAISMPVRTRYGYHIIYVKDKRPARGTMSASHIMVTFDKDKTADDKNSEQKINEIYSKLEAGESWDLLAQQYSDDTQSKNKGGKLPDFGSGTSQRMVVEFETNAFALTEDGAYSKPFKTQYGWHIVKRNALKPLVSQKEMQKELQNKVNKDIRGQKTQASFISKLKKNYNYQLKTNAVYDLLQNALDSTLFLGKWVYNGENQTEVLFEYANKTYTLEKFANHIEQTQRRRTPVALEEHINTIYNDWEKELIIGYEESLLEKKYPEYKALMQEYHDGVLLYEIMKDSVWDKAVKDTTGLKAFYEKNKQNYMHPNRIDANVYELYDKKAAKKTYKLVKKGADAKMVQDKISDGSQLNLRANSGLFDPATDERFIGQDLGKKTNKPYALNEKFYVVRVNDFVAEQPKLLKEAKGAVIQDYQNYLEQIWIAGLRTKHKITVDKDVLYNLNK
ncbi:MAG: peptidylprolyl isomerase [Lishizhenia sp.]